MATYTITAVSPQARDWNSSQGGPMKGYRVTMRDDAGQETTNVEWSRKESSPAPQVGQRVDGLIDMAAQYGPKFKQQSAGGFGGGGPRQRDPRETAAIQRQHSQEMALRYAAVKASLGQLPGDFKPTEHLRPLIDWFDSDIQFAVDRKNQQQGSAA